MKQPTTVVILVVLLGSTAPGWAQDDTTEPVPAGQQYFDQARELYADDQFAEAIPFLRQAIQAEPLGARYYIGIARAANAAGNLDLAVTYYDLYLTFFTDHANSPDRRRQDRLEEVQRERDGTNRRREQPDVLPEMASAQVAALTALTTLLEQGPFMTPNRTGAWGMYQNLLRTGYAHPNLFGIQQTLIAGILAETEAFFAPGQDTPIWIGDGPFWRTISDRYAAVEELQPVATETPLIEANIQAARGQVESLNANGERAVQYFRDALALNPDLLFAQWGLLVAAHRSMSTQGCCLGEEWLIELDRLEEMTLAQAPTYLPLVDVTRGMIYSDSGRHDLAAAALVEVLSPGHLDAIGAEIEWPVAPPPAEVPKDPPPVDGPELVTP